MSSIPGRGLFTDTSPDVIRVIMGRCSYCRELVTRCECGRPTKRPS